MTGEGIHTSVAIDGPAASGKSSVARALARKLGFTYVNTGAMYRALTWHALSKGIDTSNTDEMLALLASSEIHCGVENGESSITIDGADPTPFLREPSINANVSVVAGIQEVRRLLVDKQRDYLNDWDVVMEGRDIGSVVFPATPYKFYIDASPDVRARRRDLQGQQDEIIARDRYDSSRRTSPLIIAEDAYVIDSSNLTIDGVVGEIIGRLRLKGGIRIPE